MGVSLDVVKKKFAEGGEEGKIAAIESLRGARSNEAVGLLISALGDESWRVRKTSTSVLESYVGEESFLSSLVSLLKNPDNAGLRNSAVELLIKSGGKGVVILMAAVKDVDEGVRKFAVDILGDICDKCAVPALIEALKDRDLNVKAAATEALGKIGGTEAVSMLLKALETEDDLWVRYSVLEALSKVGAGVPVGPVAALAGDSFLRKAVMEALGSTLSAESAPYLIEGLRDKSESIRAASVISMMRVLRSLADGNQVAELVHTIGRGVDPRPLCELFNSNNPDVVKGAVSLVGMCGGAPEVKPMLRLIKDEQFHEVVRNALMSMSGRGSLDAMIKDFSSEDDRTRAYICGVIGEIKDKKSLPLLYSALSDSYGHTRSMAMMAIGRFGLMESVEKLLPLLDDMYEDVSEAAAKALTRIGELHPKGFTSTLSAWVKDKRPRARKNVARVLGGLKIKEALPQLFSLMKDEDPEVRKIACASAGKLCYVESVEHLAMALVDESAEVKLAAVRALECFSSGEDVERLLVLASKDADPWVRNAAVKGLSKFVSDNVVKTLEGALANDVAIVAIAAIDALYQAKGDKAAPIIRRALENKDASVVRAAEGKLKKLSVA